MKDRIQILKILSNLEFTEMDSSWEVHLPASSAFYFQLTIPKDVNEWFVDLYKKDTSEKIWSDWADWHLSGEINESNVEFVFQKDIEYFIERVNSATDFRIIEESAFKLFGKEFFLTKNLEALINKKWMQIEPGEIPDDYEIPE